MIEIISPQELETLLSGKSIDIPKKAPGWIMVVKSLPCMRRGCYANPANTAHHVFTWGMGMKCDDRLTIPLCIECHLIGNDPVQSMNDERFIQAIGVSKKDAVRRVYKIIMERYENGDFV